MHLVRDLAPFAVFAGFMVAFRMRARREGQELGTWMRDRQRRAFVDLRPGWWKPHVAFALAAWTVLFVASGFRPVLLVLLPVVVAWVPLWTLVLRMRYRRGA